MYAYLDELTYCLENDFPAPLTAAMLALAADRSLNRLTEAHDAWTATERYNSDFSAAVEEITGTYCAFCKDCDEVVWECSAHDVCDECAQNYRSCDSCGDSTDEFTSVGHSAYCGSCLDRYFTWCEICDEYVSNDDDDHGHACECEAPHLRFEFPNDGHGTVSQCERLTVELPKGTIDEQGMYLITRLLQQTILNHDEYFPFSAADIEAVSPVWQTKQGNFTRRVSSMLYKKHNFKIPAGVLSEIGNIARAHSSNTAEWHIDFTRRLNAPAEAFYHEDSCWFTEGSYGASRCALKQWGGLGLLSYDDDGDLSGRAWVQPLDSNLHPSHDTINAHAYVVYNGYGDLEGYTPARIIAHLTSRTYRKVQFEAPPQFINGNAGYLVSDESTCLTTDAVRYGYNPHHTTDADRLRVKVYA